MRFLFLLFDFAVICGFSNILLLYTDTALPLFIKIPVTVVLLICFVVVNVFPCVYKTITRRFGILAGGSDLLIVFLLSSLADVLIYIRMFIKGYDLWQYIVYAVIAVIVCGTVFWNGILRVYITSGQLGVWLRVLGALFGMIPVLNIVFLLLIIRKTHKEAEYEIRHDEIENARRGQNICKTKYPVLLVHGVFFRDRKLFNYWGRIPSALELNGATIYYGKQQSALCVKDSAAELSARIKEIVAETGCEKLNIIAHSKGGLDSRYAVSQLDCGQYVASLTTVNTPHRGCIFVEKAYTGLSQKAWHNVAEAYNAASRVRGDTNPDFLAAVGDLRESVCTEFNRTVPDREGVFYQSIGSATKSARGGRFPMDISYPFVKKMDGENDGLVSVESMKWGENFRFIKVKGRRGVSHGDVIDLNRENIEGFDVREYFVQVVADLKNKGY